MTELIISVLIAQANLMGIDPQLAVAIAKTESKFNPDAIGPLGEIGILQVRPEYSKYSKAQLHNIDINIREGLRILRDAKKHCKHQQDNTWVVCFNAGVAGGSNIRFPKEFEYYLRFKRNYLLVQPLMIAAQ